MKKEVIILILSVFLVSVVSAGPTFCADPNEGGFGARFYNPYGVYTTADGSRTYIADTYNHAIRVYENGGVYTLAGGDNYPDPDGGDLDGPASTALFKWPRAVTLDTDGNLLIADSGNHKIKKLELSTMMVSTIAGGNSGGGVTCSGSNNANCKNGYGTQAQFSFPSGIAVNTQNGNIFVADTTNNRIRKIRASDGYVNVLVGNGGTTGPTQGWRNEVSLSVVAPQDIEYHLDDNNQFNLYYVHGGNFHNTQRIYYDPNHNSGDYYMQHFSCQLSNPGFLDGTSEICKNNNPKGISIINSNVNGAFKIYLADYNNHAIRDITSGGSEGTYSGGNGEGSADGTSQNCNAGSIPNDECTGSISKPRGTSVDQNDNIYLTGEDHLLRMVTPSASYPDGDMLTTLAGSANVPGFVDCFVDGGNPQCSDEIDNDGDGLIDMNDPGCSSPTDNDETDPVPAQCSNLIDDDGDGLIDYPADPGCTDANDNDEEDPPLTCDNDGIPEPGQGEQCDDGNTNPNDLCNNCVITYCMDGFIQRPNGDGSGTNSGNEECDDGNNIDNDQCTNSCVLNVVYGRDWRNMNNEPIIAADAGDTVKLVYVDGAAQSLDFEIFEEDLTGDDEVATIQGGIVGNDMVATWTIPTGVIGNEQEEFYELYFNIDGGESWILSVTPEEDDDPIDGEITDPVCATDLNQGTSQSITFHLEDPDNEITMIQLSADKGDGNGPSAIPYIPDPTGSEGNYVSVVPFPFDFAGTTKITLRAENNRGERFLSISNVMVIDQTNSGNYVAACIDSPSNLYIDEDYVNFNAESSKGIKIITPASREDITLPDSRLEFFWTFSDGRINPTNSGSNLVSYNFMKYFGKYGDNWGELRLVLN